jgi:glucan phosphoethanolaminetransferase (alkaline phosphatase superfamily)
MANKRSPLKDRPLRNPGQSLDEQRQDLVNDYMLWPMVFATAMILVAAWEWVRYYRPLAPSPVIISVVATAALVFAAYRINNAMPRSSSGGTARKLSDSFSKLCANGATEFFMMSSAETSISTTS